MAAPERGDDPYGNPLARKTPLGGRTGVAVASLAPIIALVLFFAFGFLAGAWAWSWIFFLLIPVVYLVVYGVRSPGGGG